MGLGPMGGRTGMVSCSLPAPVDVAAGQVWAFAARWLAGSVVRLARHAGVLGAGPSLSHGWMWLLLWMVVSVSLCASC